MGSVDRSIRIALGLVLIDELARVMAAQRRLAANSFGSCQACGEAIDLRRLEAMPATPYCASCQALREQRPGQ